MLLKSLGRVKTGIQERDEDQSARFLGMFGKGTELCNGYWRTSRWTTKEMEGLGFVQMVAQEERLGNLQKEWQQKMKKNGVKLLLNYERSQLSPEAKIKKLRQRFVDLPFFFHSGKTVSVY